MKTNLSQYDNSWYKPGKNIFVRIAWYIMNALFFINPLNTSSRLKTILLRAFGAKIGKGVCIKPGVNIKYPWLLEIGDYSWIGENAWIDNLAKIKIGDNICISQNALLLTGNHNYKNPGFDLIVQEITLEDGVWIGANAVVCPGVTCHSHSILSVGSVATSDLQPYKIYQGNPAEIKRERVISTENPDSAIK